MIVSGKALQRISEILHGERNNATERIAATEASQRKDAVTLSAEGRHMQALQRRLTETPEVRTEKVEALRKAIEAGEYHVSAEKIAEKILEQEKVDT